MRALYAFGLLILIAFLGSRFLFRRSKIISPWSYLLISGLLYIFLGLLLGKSGLNFISSDVLHGLTPLICLGLGWLGFLFGFQLEVRYLRRFPGKYLGLSLIQAVFIFFLTVLCTLPLLRVLFPNDSAFQLTGMAVAFGILWTIHSPSLINAASGSIPNKGNYYYLARFITSISGFWGIVGLALLNSIWHYPFFKNQPLFYGILVFIGGTVFSVGLGILFFSLTKKRPPEQDLLVFLLGFVFFVSGTAFYFNIPPLYTGMVLGITFSNLTRLHEGIYPLLFSTEKTLYVVFLLLIGALWDFHPNVRIAILVILLIVLRVVGQMLPLPAARRILRFPYPVPLLFGLSFLSTGGVGIAFAVSIKMSFPLPLTDVFLTVALISILATELLSPLALRWSLLKLDRNK
ncbi:MAG: cation:proton antiporter [Candidatus Aminicenantes bacterium]|nr:cation:proton antiporter [Candidatus Aminicenantes bacterium]